MPAVLEAWYGGQNQGAALANILFGEVSPSGKLPVTFPVSSDATPISTPEQYPGIGRDSYYTEDVFVGYRGYDQFGIAPQYAFGHWTVVHGLRVLRPRREDEGQGTGYGDVSHQHRRTCRGRVTAGLVGKLPTDVVETAPKQLAGFAKVSLAPGELKRVTIELARESLSYWDSYVDSWITPKGRLDVFVAASSQDIRLEETVSVLGQGERLGNLEQVCPHRRQRGLRGVRHRRRRRTTPREVA